MTLLLFILIFGVVVVSHEFGHFIVAKLNGIRVVEFSVGMGPNLISFTRKDTKYSLKLLPIGGACMFEGEDGLTIETVLMKHDYGNGIRISTQVGCNMNCVFCESGKRK